MKFNRRGQEEMVGFVLIVLVVAVIFLVFLGIFVRQSPDVEQAESAEVSQFLDSALEFTTECSFTGYRYLQLDELIEECNANQGNECENGENVCSLMKDTMMELTESAWSFSPDARVEGYSYRMSFIPSGSVEEQLLSVELPSIDSGSGVIRGADRAISVSGGRVILELKLFLSG